MQTIRHPPTEGFPGFGHSYVTFEPIDPPLPIASLDEVAGWMNTYPPRLYWLPEFIFDGPLPPHWLAKASIDITLAPAAKHSMHLWIDSNPGLGSKQLNFYVESEELQFLTENLSEQSVDEVADEVKAWWHDMRGGKTNGQIGIVPAGPLNREA